MLEGVINSEECLFSFLNMPIPLFLKEKIVLKPKEQRLIKIETPLYRQDFRFSYSKDIRQTETKYNNVKSKIYMKFSDARYNEQ